MDENTKILPIYNKRRTDFPKLQREEEFRTQTLKARGEVEPAQRKEGEEKAKQMAETPSKIESMRKWVVDHKLRAVGCLWLTGITSSVAYNWLRPNMKASVKLIHARLHAQALTIAALVGSGLVEYYDQKYSSSGPKVDKYTRQYIANSHKD